VATQIETENPARERGRRGRGFNGGCRAVRAEVPPSARERGAEQKILPFLFRRIFGGARKSEIVKSILLGGEH